MKKENEESGNERLRKLLEKGIPADGDDFEKEALEGFAMLRDKEEAYELKARVDQRMKEEVLSKGKRQPVYWLAAAALFLVVGFSIYFIGNSDSPEKTLALSVDQKQEVIAPAEPPVSSNVQAPPPAEDRTAAEPQTRKSRSIATGAGEARPLQEHANAEMKYRTDSVTGNIIDEGLANEAYAARTRDNDANEQDLTGKSEAVQVVTYDKDNKASVAEVNVTRSEESKLFARKKVAGKEKSAGAVQEASPALSPAAVTAMPVITAKYPGGQDSLFAVVKRKLDPEQLNRKFDALLFIGATGNVVNARITDGYGLNKKEKKAIEEQLQSLKGFSVSADPGTSGLINYQLRYR